jgi:SAM-dependent methyltransferase
VPEVRALAGTAEEIPLPDASVDAITVAQAWHWVDPDRATAEAARVLRPGGTLGLIWNRRDDRVGWIVDLTEAMGSVEVEIMDMDAVEIGPPFGPTESFVTDWARPMDVDLLVDMAASRSYVITATPRRRREILDGVRQVVEADPHLGTEFDLPYRTYCYRATRP